MKFGAITDCLKQPTLREAISAAAALKLDGVQIYATTGEFSPENLTETDKTYYKTLLAENDLCVSALCGDMGGFGFEIEKDNAARIEKTKRIVDLAAEFGTNAVTTHIGVIPADERNPRYRVMLDALTACGLYAKSRGVTLAIETGPEKAETLKKFVERTEGGVGVNLDPANFVMVTAQDPAEAVYLLQEHIVHTHLKDGRKLDPSRTPEEVYHAFALGGIEALNACDGFEELPIGKGDVDWKAYLRALTDVGYSGFLTVEREAGENPLEDIAAGLSFIRALMRT